MAEPLATPTPTQQSLKRAKGDPRDDEFVVKYEKNNFQKNDGEGGLAEMYQLGSVLAGMYAFMFKTKLACWIALFMFFTSAINTKNDNRTQQIVTGFSIIMISFTTIYLTPQLPPRHF